MVMKPGGRSNCIVVIFNDLISTLCMIILCWLYAIKYARLCDVKHYKKGKCRKGPKYPSANIKYPSANIKYPNAYIKWKTINNFTRYQLLDSSRQMFLLLTKVLVFCGVIEWKMWPQECKQGCSMFWLVTKFFTLDNLCVKRVQQSPRQSFW